MIVKCGGTCSSRCPRAEEFAVLANKGVDVGFWRDHGCGFVCSYVVVVGLCASAALYYSRCVSIARKGGRC
eukprot:scaffold125916_cov26-Tisochrysis_lutea.AAC.1